MESFGSYIKSQREKRGIRLEEIASITKIHLHTLELLEQGEWDRLPPEPFIRGFIIAYGKYVGLDTKDLMERYAEEVGDRRPVTEDLTPPQDAARGPDTPGQIIESSGPLPIKRAVSALGVGTLVAVLFTIIYLGKKAAENPANRNQVASIAAEAPEGDSALTGKSDGVAPEDADSETTVAGAESESSVLSPPADRATADTESRDKTIAPGTPTASREAAAKPAGAYSHRVVVQGQEQTWIKVLIDDNAPIEAFLKPGDRVTYRAKDKIKVTLGNSTGSSVTHNGKIQEGRRFLGTIRTYQFPEDAEFPQDAGNRNPTSRELNRPD